MSTELFDYAREHLYSDKHAEDKIYANKMDTYSVKARSHLTTIPFTVISDTGL